jgi:hypothetical protein
MKISLLLLLGLALISCENNDISSTGSLEGKWVDIKTKTDTLIFDKSIAPNVFLLRRGKEIQNGHLLPKSGAGMYEFKLLPEKISVYNLLSSCYCFKEYFFLYTGSQLTVENFYDDNANRVLHTFQKLE